MRISWVLLYEYLPTANGLSVKQEERNMILATGSASGSGSMVMMIVWLAVMFAIMYFLMVRPQKKLPYPDEKGCDHSGRETGKR